MEAGPSDLRQARGRGDDVAALIIARRGYDREVKLPCEKTIRNYAHAEKHGLGKKALRRVGPRPKTGRRKRSESSSKVGHTYDDRPEEVRNPMTIGHLEGDTVCGPVGRKGVYYSFIDRLSSNQYLIYRDNRKGASTLCQRARNENNHLLVRRTSPKRHRLVHRSVKAGMAAAEYINDYPCRKFGGRSSNEVHAALLASA